MLLDPLLLSLPSYMPSAPRSLLTLMSSSSPSISPKLLTISGTTSFSTKCLYTFQTKYSIGWRIFLRGRASCTSFRDELSPTATISASAVQGSSIGPATYIVTATDMRPQYNGNVIIKYTDDMHLIVPAANSHTCVDEVLYIQAWASDNNL